MAVRKLKPTTPGQRHKIIGVFDDITKRTPEKSLTVGKRSTGGRNNEGHLTARYRGGGHRRKLRLIDFKRNKDGVPAVVKAIEYDPKLTSLPPTDLRWVQRSRAVRTWPPKWETRFH